MRVLNFLNTKYRTLFGSKLFISPIDESREYLESFPHPRDNIERSYFQYRCQMLPFPKFKRFIFHVISCPILVYYLLKTFFQEKPIFKYNAEALLLFGGSIEIVPKSLAVEYYILQIPDFQQRIALTKGDRAFIRKLIKRYPFYWYFIFKCTLKIAMFSYLIQSYSPKALICSEEYSFTSSVLTDYCEELDIVHINIMHGEKLFNITDSFFQFNRFYLWDEFYKDLFIELRAEPSQFIIECPPIMLPWEIRNIKKSIDYTYYLEGIEDELTLVSIRNTLFPFCNAGFNVAIRPHPNGLNLNKVKEKFFDMEIEDIKNIGIKESILRTHHVISIYSTVHLQALANNIPIIIDDITRPDVFNKLQELKYICLQKEHSLLSMELPFGSKRM